MAGISPIDFDRMELWQVFAQIEGFDARMKLYARIGDALAYKMIRGGGLRPVFVPFDRLFPQWAEERERKNADCSNINRRRLDEWCDEFED